MMPNASRRWVSFLRSGEKQNAPLFAGCFPSGRLFQAAACVLRASAVAIAQFRRMAAMWNASFGAGFSRILISMTPGDTILTVSRWPCGKPAAGVPRSRAQESGGNCLT